MGAEACLYNIDVNKHEPNAIQEDDVSFQLDLLGFGARNREQYPIELSTLSEGASVAKRGNAKSVLAQLDSAFSREPRTDLAPLVNWKGTGRLPIHRWFRYREAFSPKLISALGLGRRLLDPFCGCGSIVVGAAELNHVAVGIDLNPLAAFIANVKVSPLTPDQLIQADIFNMEFDTALRGSLDRWPIPSLRIAAKVFEPEILDELLALRTLIEEKADQPEVYRFLLLAWIAILQDVGSYFKEGNGIKYRNKKRLKSGYIRRDEGTWQLERFGGDQRAFVRRAYASQLSLMLQDATHWHHGNWGDQNIIQGNALNAAEVLKGQEFDSIVFSPPYANRFDYFESMKVELWFGGFVDSYDSMLKLRKQSVRSHLAADLGKSAMRIDELECLIESMDRTASSWRMRVPSALRGYFDDMYRTLCQCRALTPSGRCHIVVGNSAFAGVIVPTDSLIAHLGLLAGFDSARIMVVRHLTVAPQQRLELRGLESFMRESVVVLE